MKKTVLIKQYIMNEVVEGDAFVVPVIADSRISAMGTGKEYERIVVGAEDGSVYLCLRTGERWDTEELRGHNNKRGLIRWCKAASFWRS